MKLSNKNMLTGLLGSATMLTVALAANAATPKTAPKAPAPKMATTKPVAKPMSKKPVKTAKKATKHHVVATTKMAPKTTPKG